MTRTDTELDTWRATGLLQTNDFFAGPALVQLQEWIDSIERSGPESGMSHYNEVLADGSEVRCRTEDIVPHHPGLRHTLTSGAIAEVAGALLGEPAVLYKEKINYKLPGAAGFAPHQDAPAYPLATETISCMIAVDDMTADNGCLEVVRSAHQKLLPTDDAGCVAQEVAKAMHWEPLPVKAGSILWFHWFTPHRSSSNRSDQRRRAMYVTYNRASDGDLRAAYYHKKNDLLDPGSGRLSLIGHFQGHAHPIEDDSV